MTARGLFGYIAFLFVVAVLFGDHATHGNQSMLSDALRAAIEISRDIAGVQQ